MKTSVSFKKIIFLAVILFIPIVLLSQSPQMVSYQAVVRDASNQPIVNTSVSIIMTINQGSASGTQVYSETHNVMTNDFGLVNVYLGAGTTSDDFSLIDWSNSPYYLNINIDGNDMDPVQLVSVPYAIYSDEAGNVFSGDYNDLSNKPALNISNWNTAYGWGDHALANYLTSFTETDPVFGASPAAGIASGDIGRWTLAFNWGDHSSVGYVETETDPIFGAAPAAGISGTNISNWNMAYGWGDHSTQGYMDSKWLQTSNKVYVPLGNQVGIGTVDPQKNMLMVTADPTWAAEDPIFQVVNTDGIPVFTIYNNGAVDVQIYDSDVKGPKGGFAIGGFDVAKGTTQPYMNIYPDSTRIYFNETDAKGPKGGFAIGGFDASKGANDKYVEIRAGRTGNTGNNVFLGYQAGGEEGYNSTSNIAIGYNAGLNLGISSENNVFIGEESGMTQTNFQNVFIGTGSGRSNSTGYNNIYIGYEAGSAGLGQYNVYIGDEAGRYSNQTFANVAIGQDAGKQLGGGDQNTLIGSEAGVNLGEGAENVMIGSGAGRATTTDDNVFIGKASGYNNTTGTSNIYIGHQSGYSVQGTGNIFIGPGTGFAAAPFDANSTFVIDRYSLGDISQHFINGDMTWGARRLRFNASTGINTEPDPLYDLKIYGSAIGESWQTSSDIRLKKNIQTISEALSKVLKLRGVSFDWEKENKTNQQSIGFIAQEAIEIIPELVTKGSEYYSINYAPITALLVEAIKELKKENDDLKAELSRVDELERQIQELREAMKRE